jgi:hypothetical protein
VYRPTRWRYGRNGLHGREVPARCNAAQNGCTTTEIMRPLNSINNTPINECCDDRMNLRMGICDGSHSCRALVD